MKEIISFTVYATVDEKYDDGIVCKDLYTGNRYTIFGPTHANLSSADVFSRIENTNKTEIAKRLLESGDSVFTVEFVKQGGEPRTLRGRLVKEDPLMGRAMVEDLDIPFHEISNIRQVDLRTLKSLIIDNVKYVVK